MKKVSFWVILVITIFLSVTSFYLGATVSEKFVIATPEKVSIFYKQTEIPELKFFTISFCPNNRVENTLHPVYDLLNPFATFTPHYLFQKIVSLEDYCLSKSKDIVNCQNEKNYLKSSNGIYYTSLHGRQEANQSVRQICAWKQLDTNKTKWWNFIDLVNQNCNSENADICWEDQGKKAGLDTDKITNCFNSEAFNIIEGEINIANNYKVIDSPTIIINHTQIPNNGLTSNATKLAICNSMTHPDKSCDQELMTISTNQPLSGTCL